LGAGVLLILATDQGVGISTDSIAYLGVSDNVLDGQGLNWLSADGGWQPFTHFPPLYPLMLAGFKLFSHHSLDAARSLNVLLFSFNVILVGLILFESSEKLWLATLGGVLAGTSPILVAMHAIAQSEALFIFLGFSGLYLFVRYLKTRHFILILASALAISLTYLSRYVGITFIVTVAALILLDTDGKRREKVRNLAVILTIGFVPILVWMGRNFYLTGKATNRVLLWHPPELSKFTSAFAILWGWIVPYPFTNSTLFGMTLILIGILVAVVILCWKKGVRNCLGYTRISQSTSMRMALLIFNCVYAFILLLSMTFLDASTPLDIRITLPLYFGLGILALSLLPNILDLFDNPVWHFAIIILIALFTYSYIARGVSEARVLRYDPYGWGSPLFREDLLSEVLELDQDTIIYTNNLELLYFFYDRNGYSTPSKIDKVKMTARPYQEKRLAQMRKLLIDGKAVLVFFNADSKNIPMEWIDGLSQTAWRNHVAVFTGSSSDPK
ncbi:MAG: ArnT family glycosyltransferase, partial [Anaerolineales bacterium]